MNFILLEVLPIASWWGIVLSGIITLLGFLIRDAYLTIKRRQDSSEETAKILTEKLDGEKLNNEKALRALDGRMNDLHINILNRLDDIKNKFNEFRK